MTLDDLLFFFLFLTDYWVELVAEVLRHFGLVLVEGHHDERAEEVDSSWEELATVFLRQEVMSVAILRRNLPRRYQEEMICCC